jgi:hypothetical protein
VWLVVCGLAADACRTRLDVHRLDERLDTIEQVESGATCRVTCG